MKYIILTLSLAIAGLAFISMCHAAEPVTVYYTTNGVEPVAIDPIQMIMDSNPPCFEWMRKTTGYSKLMTKPEKCGQQIRLHQWRCAITGEIGWTPEIYQLEKCSTP